MKSRSFNNYFYPPKEMRPELLLLGERIPDEPDLGDGQFVWLELVLFEGKKYIIKESIDTDR
jgi:hypothetical protein